MSKKLVNEVAKRYVNQTKSNAVIYHSENGAPIAEGTRPYVEGKGYHYITGLVRAELVSVFMKLQTLLHSNPEQVNPNLEIIEGDNLSMVSHFTRTNKSDIIDSIDQTIKRIEKQTDFHSIHAYDDNGLDQIIAHLFGRYSARCSRATETTKDETLLINNCVKMLLELKVKGIAKNNTANID